MPDPDLDIPVPGRAGGPLPAVVAEPGPAAASVVRRRLLVASALALTGAVAAAIVLGSGVASALAAIAAAAEVAVAGEVKALILRARVAAAVAALIAAATGVGCLVWVVRRYEREMDGLRRRIDDADDHRRDRQTETRRAVVDGLVSLAGARDQDTREHLDRIRGYVRLLAEHLSADHPEVDEAFVEMVVETSPVHDIGKVGVPDEILLKPGPLTTEQRTTMQRHVLLGLDTLIEVKRRYGDDDYLRIACEIAFAHHERFDGSGYPFGLSGDNIPLAARIVAVADVYDALRNERVYKDAFDHPTARDIIVEHRGTHFDPEVVAAFLEVESAFASIAERSGAPGPHAGLIELAAIRVGPFPVGARG